jgi:late competence protein required for DNA uptake (superfamily II DNA/RNA helicase)
MLSGIEAGIRKMEKARFSRKTLTPTSGEDRKLKLNNKMFKTMSLTTFYHKQSLLFPGRSVGGEGR